MYMYVRALLVYNVLEQPVLLFHFSRPRSWILMSGKGGSNSNSYRPDELTHKEPKPSGKSSPTSLRLSVSWLLLDGTAHLAENLPFSVNHSRKHSQTHPETCVLVDSRSTQGDNQDVSLSIEHKPVCQGIRTQNKKHVHFQVSMCKSILLMAFCLSTNSILPTVESGNLELPLAPFPT